MNRPYSEATLDLIAEAEGARRNGKAGDGRGWFRTAAEREECYAIADAALEALADLLPEGAETRYAAGVAAGRAQAAADIRDHPGPDPSPASPAWWAGYSEALRDAVRLAVGDSKPSVQDPSVSVEETTQ